MKNPKELDKYFLRDINPVIRLLIISDAVIIGGASLLAPVFALFISQFIEGGNAAVVGISASVYLFTKSVFQVPVANLIDRIKGERDDFWFMFVFTIAMALLPLFYLVISKPIQLYILQFISGIIAAFTFPTFMAIFTRHIDKEKEGTEWGIYFTLIDLMGAAAAGIGGYIAAVQGFRSLIISAVIVSLIGSLLLYLIKPYLKI